MNRNTVYQISKTTPETAEILHMRPEGSVQTQQETPVSGPIQEESLGFDSTPKASGNLNVGSLVWSIINLVLCCMPLGIASLIMTVLAKDAPSAEDEEKKLKIARICNLIGTLSVAIVSIFYIVFVVVGVVVGVSDALTFFGTANEVLDLVLELF